jgi:Holliday junction resolvase RusA-like endonuclease
MASERKRWRARVALEIGMRRPKSPCEKVKAVFTRHSARECDDDNLVASFKSCRDGIKDAGVIEDDTRKRIIAVYRWEKAPQNKGFITIDIEEVLE